MHVKFNEEQTQGFVAFWDTISSNVWYNSERVTDPSGSHCGPISYAFSIDFSPFSDFGELIGQSIYVHPEDLYSIGFEFDASIMVYLENFPQKNLTLPFKIKVLNDCTLTLSTTYVFLNTDTRSTDEQSTVISYFTNSASV